MSGQLQGYTKNEAVDAGLEKAAKLLGKSRASIIGQAVEEMLDAMGLLGESDKQNVWEMLSELIRKGVSHEKITEAYAALMEDEVIDE
jgi:hypothetical protein